MLQVVSAEERAEVNSARLRKMEAITARVRSGDRREVYPQSPSPVTRDQLSLLGDGPSLC